MNINNERWSPQYPLVAASAIIFKEEKLLLIKRANEPSKGKWSIPGGIIELGETIYEAARREVLEECSIDIEITKIFNVMDNIIRDEDGSIRFHYILVDVLARYVSGEIKAQSDAEDCLWFTSEELAGLDMNPRLHEVLARAFSS